jgi:hypothetical protein
MRWFKGVQAMAVCHFVAPNEDDEAFGVRRRSWGFGGGGGGGGGAPSYFSGYRNVALGKTKAYHLSQFLSEAVPTPASTVELAEDLAFRMRDTICDALRVEGLTCDAIVDAKPVVEPSYERARRNLRELMSSVRENLVVTITSRNSIENAVALVDPKALYVLLDMAQKALGEKEQFGDLVTERISRDEADALSRLEVHRPLPRRQGAAERRAVLDEVRLDENSTRAETT